MKNHIVPLIQFGITLVFCIGASGYIGENWPVYLYTALIVSFLGFLQGKSTKVPRQPLDFPISPMVKLSYREFDAWAHRNNLALTDQSLFLRNDLHWTEKLSILTIGSSASNHCMEPSRSSSHVGFVSLFLGLFIFIPSIHEPFYSMKQEAMVLYQFLFGLVLGLIVGKATGNFYRWLRGTV